MPRRPSTPAGGRASIAPELTPAERAAALSRLGRPAPEGTPLDAARLDAARDRLRAAATPPAVIEPSAPTAVDPAALDAAQRRLRGRRRPAQR